MRVLVVHRFFSPDVPPYAEMLRHIAGQLAGDGHDVTVLTTQPSYNGAYRGARRPSRERVDGYLVRRLPVPPDTKGRPLQRAVGMGLFALLVALYGTLHRRRFDVMMVTTMPPLVMGLAARAVRATRRTRFVYHCMDLYPEVAEVAGLARRGVRTRLLRRLDTSTCRRADTVVVLSDDMRATLVDRGLSDDDVVILNNFEIEDVGAAPTAAPGSAGDDRFRVVFAGNMGRFQGLETLVDAATALADDPSVAFTFVGAGSEAAALEERAGDAVGRSVEFLPHQPLATVFDLLRRCDVGIVALQPGVFRVAYPSKVMSYLKAGCRIVAVVEAESELARLVTEQDLGSACRPGDVDQLVAALRTEMRRGRLTTADRARATSFCQDVFSKDAVLPRWSALYATVGGRR